MQRDRAGNIDGFINVYKEKGWTSHDVIAKLRGVLGVKKLGHAGTLDPAAEGVLLVAAGKGTRILEYLEEDQKTYHAEILFGYETDTEDMEGTITKHQPVTLSQLKNFDQELQSYKGSIEQIPPMYSAVKINGERLYKKARKNEMVERPARTVSIYETQLIRSPYRAKDNEIRAEIALSCSKGTYVRTYCKDLCHRCGVIGVLSSLVRTRVGRFNVKQAHTVKNIVAMKSKGDDSYLLPISTVQVGEKIKISDYELLKRVTNGASIYWDQLDLEQHLNWVESELYTIFNSADELVAVAMSKEIEGRRKLNMKKVFPVESDRRS